MANEATRIVRPWVRLGGRYEVGVSGIRYYRLAWLASISSLAPMVLHALGWISISTGVGVFLFALAVCCLLCLLTMRHGRRVVE